LSVLIFNIKRKTIIIKKNKTIITILIVILEYLLGNNTILGEMR
jgi:hypothetical protein